MTFARIALNTFSPKHKNVTSETFMLLTVLEICTQRKLGRCPNHPTYS